MSASGFCPQFTAHPRGHEACQQRQDHGLLGGCDCRMHGGHRATAPAPVQADASDEPLEVAS